jgi:hypothetical protein
VPSAISFPDWWCLLPEGGKRQQRLSLHTASTQRPEVETDQRLIDMLYTIAVVLIILWLLGLVTSYTMGGLIHVLLVIAIVMVLLRVISGRAVL